MSEIKTGWSIAKLQLGNIRVAYLVAGICAGVMLLQTIVAVVLLQFGIDMSGGGGNENISVAWYAWLLLLVGGIVMARGNFARILNLGAKRGAYFWGSLWTYIVLSGAASLVVTAFSYLVDRPLTAWGQIGYFWAAPDIFGWSAHGPVVAFLQQWAFLLLLAVVVHTLTASLDKWYGWVAAATIITIISVFTPIAPLRHAEAAFFYLILFHPSAWAQIGACLVLAAGIYALNKPIFARRAV